MKKLILFFALLLVSHASLACSCALSGLEEKVERAESIYLARLISASQVSPENENGFRELFVGGVLDTDKFLEFVGDINQSTHLESVFQVGEVFKGENLPQTILLKTGLGDGDCGVPMTFGVTYIIFQEADSDTINVCAGSRPMGGHEEIFLEEIRTIVESSNAN